jgi:hypothetical protein
MARHVPTPAVNKEERKHDKACVNEGLSKSCCAKGWFRAEICVALMDTSRNPEKFPINHTAIDVHRTARQREGVDLAALTKSNRQSFFSNPLSTVMSYRRLKYLITTSLGEAIS